MDTAIFDFAERAGQENIKFHIDSAECLAKESNTTLTILLAGAGTSLGYCIKLVELGTHPYLNLGTACLSGYLFILAFTLLCGAMSIKDIHPPTNEPKNLMIEGLTIDDVRQDELKNLQARIEINSKRNEKTAAWLNGIRLASTFTPILFLIGLGIGVLIWH